MNNVRCINLACTCQVDKTADACSSYCEHPPAEPRADVCECGHPSCAREMQDEIRSPADQQDAGGGLGM